MSRASKVYIGCSSSDDVRSFGVFQTLDVACFLESDEVHCEDLSVDHI